jgi:hypothetical protein
MKDMKKVGHRLPRIFRMEKATLMYRRSEKGCAGERIICLNLRF